jgi:hypothetical protein
LMIFTKITLLDFIIEWAGVFCDWLKSVAPDTGKSKIY